MHTELCWSILLPVHFNIPAKSAYRKVDLKGLVHSQELHWLHPNQQNAINVTSVGLGAHTFSGFAAMPHISGEPKFNDSSAMPSGGHSKTLCSSPKSSKIQIIFFGSPENFFSPLKINGLRGV